MNSDQSTQINQTITIIELQCECGRIYKGKPEDKFCSDCAEMIREMDPNYKKPRKYLYPEIDKVSEGLYLGNEDASLSNEILQKLNISSILIAGNGLKKAFPEQYQYKCFEINDLPDQSIEELFEEANEFISGSLKEKKNVLMHCAQGASRSASFVLAYLMYMDKIGFEEAYQRLKAVRGCVNLNEGFRIQLKRFEEKLKKINEEKN